MTDDQHKTDDAASDDERRESRRAFLIGMGRWSKAVVAGVLVGGGLLGTDRDASAHSWINRRGGRSRRGTSWVDRRGGGWANRRGGGSWLNLR